MAEKYYSWSPYVYVGNNPIRLIDPDGRSWREGWKYLKQSFSLRVSLGLQAGVKAEVGNIKVSADVNLISADVVKIDGNADKKVNSGDINQGISIGIGVASASIEQTVHDNGDKTATRTTTKEAGAFGFAVESTTTEQFQENRDGSYTKNDSKTETNTEVKASDIKVSIAAGVGVEVKVDTKLLVQGLDEILNK